MANLYIRNFYGSNILLRCICSLIKQDTFIYNTVEDYYAFKIKGITVKLKSTLM